MIKIWHNILFTFGYLFDPLLLRELNFERVLSLAVGYATDVTAVPFLCFVV